jgi:cell division protein FtsQ
MKSPKTNTGVWKRRGSQLSLLLLLVTTLVVSVGAFAWRDDLTVRDVRVQGTVLLPSSEVIRLAAVPTGEKLFGVDPDRIRQNVETHPFVRSAAVSRDVPGTVTIAVRERIPFAVLVAPKLAYVDEDGCILPYLAQNRPLDLPCITGVGNSSEWIPGRILSSPRLQEALALLKDARLVSDELFHNISEVSVTQDGDMLCTMAESGVPVMIGQEDYGQKLLKLDAFWKERVTVQGAQHLQYVDLRFEDQVVARWNQGHELALQEGTIQ